MHLGFPTMLKAALTLYAGYLMWLALRSGKIQAVRGSGGLAERRDAPIIYWGAMVLYAVLFLNFLRMLLEDFGLKLG